MESRMRHMSANRRRKAGVTFPKSGTLALSFKRNGTKLEKTR